MCGSFLPSLWLVGATKAYRGIGAVIVYGIISLATGSMGVIDFVNFVINPEVRLRLLLWRGLLHGAIRITPCSKFRLPLHLPQSMLLAFDDKGRGISRVSNKVIDAPTQRFLRKPLCTQQSCRSTGFECYVETVQWQRQPLAKCFYVCFLPRSRPPARRMHCSC